MRTQLYLRKVTEFTFYVRVVSLISYSKIRKLIFPLFRKNRNIKAKYFKMTILLSKYLVVNGDLAIGNFALYFSVFLNVWIEGPDSDFWIISEFNEIFAVFRFLNCQCLEAL